MAWWGMTGKMSREPRELHGAAARSVRSTAGRPPAWRGLRPRSRRAARSYRLGPPPGPSPWPPNALRSAVSTCPA